MSTRLSHRVNEKEKVRKTTVVEEGHRGRGQNCAREFKAKVCLRQTSKEKRSPRVLCVSHEKDMNGLTRTATLTRSVPDALIARVVHDAHHFADTCPREDSSLHEWRTKTFTEAVHFSAITEDTERVGAHRDKKCEVSAGRSWATKIAEREVATSETHAARLVTSG